MMDVNRKKGSIFPRKYGPVNWYNAPLDLNGKPFRFLWPTELLRKIIISSLRACPNARSNYAFKPTQIPYRYWKEPVGYPRARPIARGQEHLCHQLKRLDFAGVHQWVEVTA